MSGELRLPTDPRALDALRRALGESPVIVELRFGHSTPRPERQVFHGYEMLL